jgi:hypothetical protein
METKEKTMAKETVEMELTNKKESQVAVQTPSKQDAFLDLLERLVTNPDADVEKMQRIIDMQEQVLNRNAQQAFNAAMTRAQNKIELVIAKEKNEQTHSTYADLKAVLMSAKPIYTAEGFSLMFYEGETAKENHTRICVDIMHEQGHTEKRHVDMAIQTTGIAGKAMMTQIHGEASAFMYGRRNLTCMIFNIPTGIDDDGNAAGGSMEPITKVQVDELHKEITERNVDLAKFLKVMKVKMKIETLAKIEDIPQNQYVMALSAVKSKQKQERTPGEEG